MIEAGNKECARMELCSWRLESDVMINDDGFYLFFFVHFQGVQSIRLFGEKRY